MTTKNDRAAWLKGDNCGCSHPARAQEHPHRIVLLGAPGVGKGTQATLLAQRLAACHLSTGDIFRNAKALPENERSPAMAKAVECMKRGELVTDATVLSLLAERSGCLRCGGGFLLDGFPRTVAQAESLERMLAKQSVELDTVLNYEMPLEQIVTRLSGRLFCPKCRAVFHATAQPPFVAGKCDHCGTELCQREDDRPESIRVRMEAYEKSTLPLKDFYQRKGLLASVSADGTPEEIFWRAFGVIDARKCRQTAGDPII